MDLSQLVSQYRPNDEAIQILADVPVLLLAGISGAGKDTIKEQLLVTGDYHDIVSHTTRPPRENHGILEQSGVEYHFIDKTAALSMLENHEFIEANEYVGNVYGTSVEEFQRARNERRIAITDMDVNGIKNMKRMAPDTVRPVFLTPPSYEVWRDRWMHRYGDGTKYNPEDYTDRLQTAIDEIEHVLAADYYFIVINDDLNMAVAEVNEIAHGGQQDDTHRRKGVSFLKTMLADMKADL